MPFQPAGASTVTVGNTVAVNVNGSVPVIGQALGSTINGGALNTIALTGNGPSTTITILSPGPKQAELHLFQLAYTITTSAINTTGFVNLQRTDNSADLIAPQQLFSAATGATVALTYSKDFQGVILPAGVGVKLVISQSGTTTVNRANVDLNYTLVN